jgi:hypothetical protein
MDMTVSPCQIAIHRKTARQEFRIAALSGQSVEASILSATAGEQRMRVSLLNVFKIRLPFL